MGGGDRRRFIIHQRREPGNWRSRPGAARGQRGKRHRDPPGARSYRLAGWLGAERPHERLQRRTSGRATA